MEAQEPSRLASHLQDLFGRRNWHALWLTFTITKNWHGIVGKDIAGRSEPAYIQKKILWVFVRDSVWMQHLQAMKPQLLERVHRGFPEADIQDIRWLLQQAEPLPADRQADSQSIVKADPEQARAFTQLTSIIDNKECREALCRLWQTFHQHQEYK